MVDWLEDTQRILHWYMDPKNHDEVAAIAGRFVKAPPERMGWVFTKIDQYRDPDMMPDLAALQRNVDMTKELGYAQRRASTSKHIPTSAWSRRRRKRLK